MGDAEAPVGAAGVLVVGEVVRIREALAGTATVNDVKTGSDPITR
jgi:hypothetical protein